MDNALKTDSPPLFGSVINPTQAVELLGEGCIWTLL